MSVVWLSPLHGCDLCGAAFDGSAPMYDAKVRGPWGNICHTCFEANGCRLGTGLGQRYELQELDGKKAWVKTQG